MSNKSFLKFGLSEKMLKAITKLGYTEPTKVQQSVIPEALRKFDIIVKSETGSGKTAAFAIPICENIELEVKDPQVLVLTPTRELAVQVKEDFSYIGRFEKIRSCAVYGRQPIEVQKRELRQRVHVVVGTPGRTLDHIQKENLKIAGIKYLIIDEADKMLDMGFIDEVESIIKLLPVDRQTMLFSATMPDKIEDICAKYMKDPKRIEIEPNRQKTEIIDQYYYEAEESEKFEILKSIIYIERPKSSIIFCSTRERVEALLDKMKKESFICEALHGGMEQKDRLLTIDRFKMAEFDFLVATDIAARGIHIDDISHVINYDVPMEKESYVHRIGRTGRMEKTGVAITLVSKREQRFLSDIKEYIGYSIPKKDKPSEDEVKEAEIGFKNTKRIKKIVVTSKTEELDKEITKIRINAGKDKKMRPGDIVGGITSIKGVSVEDIGIIDIQQSCSYVEIFGGKGDYILKALQNTKIKGKAHIVRKV